MPEPWHVRRRAGGDGAGDAAGRLQSGTFSRPIRGVALLGGPKKSARRAKAFGPRVKKDEVIIIITDEDDAAATVADDAAGDDDYNATTDDALMMVTTQLYLLRRCGR